MRRYQYHHIRVWDAVTRSWHWLLAFTVISGWLLGEFRTFSIMQWHFYAGYCTGGLLLFRLYWGFFGPPSVRFAALIPRPRELVAYVRVLFRREPSGVAGHSPMGGSAVLIMLTLLIVQVCTGLFSEDDALFHEGPLADTVSSATSRKATAIHHQNSSLLLIMFGLHVGIMVFYHIWKKENLVGAMFSGRKLVRVDEERQGRVDEDDCE